MSLNIPAQLAVNCRKTAESGAWLARAWEALRMLERRWSLTMGAAFDGAEGSCAWVAPVVRADGTPAVLKFGMPHMEGEHEREGLRFWDGDPTVRLLAGDDESGAMLLERCLPGTVLRALPEPAQDLVIAQLLRRLWRVPPAPHAFRPLSTLMEHWSSETMRQINQCSDSGLVHEGLRL